MLQKVLPHFHLFYFPQFYIKQFLMTEIDSVLKPKTVPIRSICLKPINEEISERFFTCTCQMCVDYEHKTLSSMMQKQQNQFKEAVSQKRNFDHQQRVNYYLWMYTHLMIPHHKLIRRGLDVFIPEIVFFNKDGDAYQLLCTREQEDPTIKRLSKGNKEKEKDKITITLIQKLFNDRRRKYREYMKNKNSLSTEKKLKQLLMSAAEKKKQTGNKDYKEAVIVCMKEGNQYVMEEYDFRILLMKRLKDPVYKRIAFIKNFVELSSGCEAFFFKYIHGNHLYPGLFERAKRLMKVYGLYIHKSDKGYISDAEEEAFTKKIKKKSHQLFAQYTLYKIVNYIEYFYDERIMEMNVKLILNERKHIYLESIYELEVKELVKFQWTNETYEKKMDQEQRRVLLDKPIEKSKEVEEKAKEIEENMGKFYQNMKNAYGLSIQEEDNTEEKANNNFFRGLYPNFKLDISEVLRDPDMSVHRFKKQFLGHKPARKPLVKPFNSNMVNKLNRLTPRLHRAEPHEYIMTPKRGLSTRTHSKRNSLCRTTRNSQIREFTID